MKPEASEVVSVLGAWVYCFRKPVKEEHIVRKTPLHRRSSVYNIFKTDMY